MPRRLLPLLKERAAIERLSFDYSAAKGTLAEVTRLDPDDVWALIDLGDLYVTTGSLAGAEQAFRAAAEASRRQGNDRDLSVSYERVGNVQKEQGDLAGALKSFSDSLAIAERLAKAEPRNMEWQRDLSVSFNKLSDVRKEQGDLTGALTSYRDSLEIRDRLATSDPSNEGWQRDLAVSYGRCGLAYRDMGENNTARDSFRRGREIMARLTQLSPDNARLKQDLAWFDEQISALDP